MYTFESALVDAKPARKPNIVFLIPVVPVAACVPNIELDPPVEES